MDITIPSITKEKGGLIVQLNSLIRLEVSDSVPFEEQVVVRGNGMKILIRVTYRDRRSQNERFIELLGKAVSQSKLWEQLLLSASLEIPERCTSREDIVLHMTRLDINDPTWSSSSIEGQIKRQLSTAELTQINLDIKLDNRTPAEPDTTTLFEDNELLHHSQNPSPHGLLEALITWPELEQNADILPPQTILEVGTELEEMALSVLDILPILDIAFISLMADHLAKLAPCLFSVGYLKSMSQSASYISVISGSIRHVQQCSRNTRFREKLSNMSTEKNLWNLMQKKLKCTASLKYESLMSWGDEMEQEHMLRLLMEPEGVFDYTPRFPATICSEIGEHLPPVQTPIEVNERDELCCGAGVEEMLLDERDEDWTELLEDPDCDMLFQTQDLGNLAWDINAQLEEEDGGELLFDVVQDGPDEMLWQP